MQLLKNLGYDEKFRAEILNSGQKGYNKIVKAEGNGIKPMYCPKGWNTTCPLANQEEEEKQLAGPLLAVGYLCPSNARV